MKWINKIFIMLLLFACKNENERMIHSNLEVNNSISNTLKNDDIEDVSKGNEPQIILGSLQFKLNHKDQKIIYLNTLSNYKNINKEYKYGKSKEAEYFTTYLGQIKLNGKENKVFKQFYIIQAAIEKHGHSVIIFLNKAGAFYYDMEMPENLPIDLKNDSFRFKHKNDTLTMKIEHVSENDLIFTKNIQ